MQVNLKSFLAVCCLVTAIECLSADSTRIPVVYHPLYTLSLGNSYVDAIVQSVHPFDLKKYTKIYQYLQEKMHLTPHQMFFPEGPVSEEQLLQVHTKGYLDSLKSSLVISRAVDLAEVLAVIPNSVLQEGVLKPMRFMAAGTLKAVDLAVNEGFGYAINIGGGFHHAKKDAAKGGCIFGDIQLAVTEFHKKYPEKSVVIVDLDAHQGNGYEDYFKDSFDSKHRNVFIFDMYNKNEMPGFGTNKDATQQYIDANFPLEGGKLAYTLLGVDISSIDHFGLTEHVADRAVNDTEYLTILKTHFPKFLDEITDSGKQIGLIIYNAGTDILNTDKWGCMDVSASGIIERDAFVFTQAKNRSIPTIMLLSGGYSPESADVVSRSIHNIVNMFTKIG